MMTLEPHLFRSGVFQIGSLWMTSLLVALLGTQVLPVLGASNTRIDFNREVRPLLVEHCYPCHGPDLEKRKGGLRLDRPEGATLKLASGARAVVPGNPQDPACCKSSRAPTPMSTCRRLPRASSCLRHKWRCCVGGSRRGRSLRGIGLTKGLKTPHRPPSRGRAGCATASTPSSCPDWKRRDWLLSRGRSPDTAATCQPRPHRTPAHGGRGGCVSRR